MAFGLIGKAIGAVHGGVKKAIGGAHKMTMGAAKPGMKMMGGMMGGLGGGKPAGPGAVSKKSMISSRGLGRR